MTHGPRKKPLDSGGYPDFTLGLGLRLGEAPPYSACRQDECYLAFV